MTLLDKDRLFPTDPAVRWLARELYEGVQDLPIISPRGHSDPRWFAENAAFPDPAQLFVTPDHYVYRMLNSLGVPLEALGVPTVDGTPTEQDPRKVWRLFAQNYHLLRGTPSRLWVDHALQEVFGVSVHLSADTADDIYDRIADCLQQEAYRPRALFERFKIEAISTTESALKDLNWLRMIRDSGWGGKVVTAYRPDTVVDPDYDGFATNIEKLGEDATTWPGYLAAHHKRRAFFKSCGATSTDHGHPTARTDDLSPRAAALLFDKALQGTCTPDEADSFRGHMLTEMARFGRDKGFDILTRTDYVHALRPLLKAVGHEPGLAIIVFTLDDPFMPANWPLWRVCTLPSSSDRRGGFMTAPR